jgi:hypothetical protein
MHQVVKTDPHGHVLCHSRVIGTEVNVIWSACTTGFVNSGGDRADYEAAEIT